MPHKHLKDGASHLSTGGRQLSGLIEGVIAVKWMLDWDIHWRETEVMLGIEWCKKGAWGCSGGRRWDGEPNRADTWIQGSCFCTGLLVFMDS